MSRHPSLISRMSGRLVTPSAMAKRHPTLRARRAGHRGTALALVQPYVGLSLDTWGTARRSASATVGPQRRNSGGGRTVSPIPPPPLRRQRQLLTGTRGACTPPPSPPPARAQRRPTGTGTTRWCTRTCGGALLWTRLRTCASRAHGSLQHPVAATAAEKILMRPEGGTRPTHSHSSCKSDSQLLGVLGRAGGGSSQCLHQIGLFGWCRASLQGESTVSCFTRLN